MGQGRGLGEELHAVPAGLPPAALALVVGVLLFLLVRECAFARRWLLGYSASEWHLLAMTSYKYPIPHSTCMQGVLATARPCYTKEYDETICIATVAPRGRGVG